MNKQALNILLPTFKTSKTLQSLGFMPPIGTDVHVFYNDGVGESFGSFDAPDEEGKQYFQTSHECIPIDNVVFRPTLDQIRNYIIKFDRAGYFYDFRCHLDKWGCWEYEIVLYKGRTLDKLPTQIITTEIPNNEAETAALCLCKLLKKYKNAKI
jgi:hypothetical protein